MCVVQMTQFVAQQAQQQLSTGHQQLHSSQYQQPLLYSPQNQQRLLQVATTPAPLTLESEGPLDLPAFLPGTRLYSPALKSLMTNYELVSLVRMLNQMSPHQQQVCEAMTCETLIQTFYQQQSQQQQQQQQRHSASQFVLQQSGGLSYSGSGSGGGGGGGGWGSGGSTRGRRGSGFGFSTNMSGGRLNLSGSSSGSLGGLGGDTSGGGLNYSGGSSGARGGYSGDGLE
jgi:hypothetical protein